MNGDEARGAARLGGTVLRGTTNRIHELHSGIAGRAFDGVGPAGGPVRKVHDSIAALAYRSVASALDAGAAAVGGATARTSSGGPVDETSRGRTVLSVLNGMYGDLVAREAPALSLTMTVRQAGRAVPVDAPSLREAFPEAGSRLVVLLHGLTENEGSWGYRSAFHHGRPGVTYGDLLHEQLGYTPVYLRYNTGLHISDNGRTLAELLEQLVLAWAVPVQDLVLIGHSMGGLVARSALHHARGGTREAAPWTRLVRDTITLGTPHLGAPLERGTHALTHTLARLPETRPLARLLALRSVGIKDLRRGTLVGDDWADRDLDAREPAAHTHVPLHDGARHFIVLATLASDPNARLGDVLGDLLVMPRSAVGDTGDDQRLAFPPDHVHRLGRLHHFDLLNHPKVYRQIRTWLESRPEGAAPDAPAAAGL
jgi:pimeloyl-ACP methyl ester carboxylesterase